MAFGIALGGVGLALMALVVSVDSGCLSILPGMLAMGIGMGFAMAPSAEAITSSLPPEKLPAEVLPRVALLLPSLKAYVRA